MCASLKSRLPVRDRTCLLLARKAAGPVRVGLPIWEVSIVEVMENENGREKRYDRQAYMRCPCDVRPVEILCASTETFLIIHFPFLSPSLPGSNCFPLSSTSNERL
jgi:hypothetical protein